MFVKKEIHLRRYDISGCPQEHFIADLVHFITKVVHDNDEVILAGQINECTISRKLPKELKEIRIIGLFAKKFNAPGPASYAIGSKLIDGVQVIINLVWKKVLIFSQHVGASSHRVMLVNLKLDRIVEKETQNMQPINEKTHLQNTTLVEYYNRLLQDLLQAHKIL